MTNIPFIAVGVNELGEPAEVISCKRCGEQHTIEYGTSQSLLADNTWSEPVPSKTLGFYTCSGALFLGTINGRKL